MLELPSLLLVAAFNRVWQLEGKLFPVKSSLVLGSSSSAEAFKPPQVLWRLRYSYPPHGGAYKVRRPCRQQETMTGGGGRGGGRKRRRRWRKAVLGFAYELSLLAVHGAGLMAGSSSNPGFFCEKKFPSNHLPLSRTDLLLAVDPNRGHGIPVPSSQPA